MQRARFDDYIRRFNEEDPTAFDEFLAPDMKMLNGALEFTGIEGMRHHYQHLIWPNFVERLTVQGFVSDETSLAVRMWTRFTARADADTLFGSVKQGELLDYRGVIFYEIRDGRFASITVAYNSFVNTRVTGEIINMGLPH